MIGAQLIGADAIARRVSTLGAEISRDYAGKTPVLLGILNAGAPFLADLTRAISIPCEFDLIAVTAFDSLGSIRFEKDTAASIEGRDVVLVDDTFDTGRTLQYVLRALRSRAPASLALCALLERDRPRSADITLVYRGFKIPDLYAVGYGLDFGGRYRELPALHIYERDV